MPIKDYKEKDIRKQILNKIKPRKGQTKRSKHEKGYIYLEEKLVAKVKIPNGHQRIMKNSKSQYIASDLKLNADQFNDMVDCPMTGPQYYEILKDVVGDSEDRQHS